MRLMMMRMMMRLMKMNMNIGGVGVGGLDSVMTPLLPGDPSPSLGWPSAGWGGDDDTSHTHCKWNMSIKMKMVISI